MAAAVSLVVLSPLMPCKFEFFFFFLRRFFLLALLAGGFAPLETFELDGAAMAPWVSGVAIVGEK